LNVLGVNLVTLFDIKVRYLKKFKNHWFRLLRISNAGEKQTPRQRSNKNYK